MSRIPEENKDTELPPCDSVPTDERATLEGWAFVEGKMQKDDEERMGGHLKDIDTLLVFAGLFSAVLTAFVVESYQQLQLDTGTGSMLVLRRISVQLETFTLSPGFANSSSSAPPLPSLDFVADSATRWINALWFLSLIFSLASALFGIMVKQWIREYMQWNSALAPPRDNVLVRQIRFEAWNDWNVPATIASIPALLEIALVLFVCGLVILLWTLDPVVSVVITTAGTVFLAIASTFTILPAFFQRCPYKSPTAWAIAVLRDIVVLWIPWSARLLLFRLGLKLLLLPSVSHRRYGWIMTLSKWLLERSDHVEWRLGRWQVVSRNWRARDLAGVWSSFAPSSNLAKGDPTALLDALISELSCADGVHTCTEATSTILPCRTVPERDCAQQPLYDALCTVTELPHLIHALAWVLQASQDAHAQSNVSHCLESLESRFVLPEPMIKTNQNGWALTQEGVRTISVWHLLLSFSRNTNLTTLGGRTIWKSMDSFRSNNALDNPRMCNRHEENGNSWGFAFLSIEHLLSPTENSRLAIPLVVRFSALSLRTIVRDSLNIPDLHNDTAFRSARRAMELLASLRHICSLDMDNLDVRMATQCLLSCVVNATERHLIDSKYPGLCARISEVAGSLGETFAERARGSDYQADYDTESSRRSHENTEGLMSLDDHTAPSLLSIAGASPLSVLHSPILPCSLPVGAIEDVSILLDDAASLKVLHSTAGGGYSDDGGTREGQSKMGNDERSSHRLPVAASDSSLPLGTHFTTSTAVLPAAPPTSYSDHDRHTLAPPDIDASYEVPLDGEKGQGHTTPDSSRHSPHPTAISLPNSSHPECVPLPPSTPPSPSSTHCSVAGRSPIQGSDDGTAGAGDGGYGDDIPLHTMG